MDIELVIEIQKVINAIRQYESGNDEYFEDVLCVVDALTNNKHRCYRRYLCTYFIMLFSKLTTIRVNKELLSIPYYQEISKCCEDNLKLYLECTKLLDKYAKTCLKTAEFPDLEAAYLLSVKMSMLLDTIMDYISEARIIDHAYQSSFEYVPNNVIYDRDTNYRNEVNVLVQALKK